MMTEYVSESDNEIAEALDPFFQELRSKVGVPFAAHLIGGINEMVETRIRNERERAILECAEKCREQFSAFLSPEYARGQPHSSFSERFACSECEREILALLPTPPALSQEERT